MKYIIRNGKVVATADSEVNLQDLQSRGETLIEQDDEIAVIEAEIENGKIVKHVITQEEIEAISKKLQEMEDNKKISVEIKQLVLEKFKDKNE